MLVIAFIAFFVLVLAWLMAPNIEAQTAPAPAPEPAPVLAASEASA